MSYYTFTTQNNRKNEQNSTNPVDKLEIVENFHKSEKSNKIDKFSKINQYELREKYLDRYGTNLEETPLYTFVKFEGTNLRLKRAKKIFDFPNMPKHHCELKLNKTCVSNDSLINPHWNYENDKIAHCKARPTHFPSPRQKLPGHRESYNPPMEHITSNKSLAYQWQNETHNLMPLTRKYNSLRSIPFYKPFFDEVFNRCLNLYLCPRVKRERLHINPKEIFTTFPKNKTLEPFPQSLGIIYTGHRDIITTISPDPTGQWLASGSADGTKIILKQARV